MPSNVRWGSGSPLLLSVVLLSYCNVQSRGQCIGDTIEFHPTAKGEPDLIADSSNCTAAAHDGSWTCIDLGKKDLRTVPRSGASIQ
jgi:hypothetical protein